MTAHFSNIVSAANKQTQNDLSNLPKWDLSDLYRSVDAPDLQDDLKELDQSCRQFEADYKTKLTDLDSTGLLNCLQRYEKILQLAGRISSFAYLRHCQQTTDPKRIKFLSDCKEEITKYTARLVFFPIEINQINDAALARHFAESASLARYKPEFDRLRTMKPFQLSDELEHCLHDLSVVSGAWSVLFDETVADLSFEIDGDRLSLESTLDLLTDTDRERRERASRELARVITNNVKTFARILNTQAKEKEVIDRWRGMPTPQTAMHLYNRVEPEVVEALRTSVVDAFPTISHRYYDLKRCWLGLDKLQHWDRNAPLPFEDTRLVAWQQGCEIVLNAFKNFSPQMAQIATQFFEKGWIDAGVTDGKSPGAFCHPTVTNVHPYILLNYLGKPRDVMTLAHELGHGVHQTLAADQGQLLADTPLILAETASVFGEMLTFRSLLTSTETTQQRKSLLANKVEDMINTLVRQIAFYNFECQFHSARRNGELTPEDINQIWLSVQSESLGSAFQLSESYSTYWAYIPHFVHSPFYVYAYAFGDGLVNALYAIYEQATPDFEEKYLSMLKAGGSKLHSELLAPFKLDASSSSFWSRGIAIIEGLIDELEAME
ncbi:MAG: M3 family oligoendopeptidase [Aestuariivita sp.]|nr:M3 family oligoendopeptidase [Aestuariivita sp.]MCY4203262.1 M3 family oligoendopeptidase [Aestuariivita sp.]